MSRSKRVIIFSGPDGSGKTITALMYAKGRNAAYVHHGPYTKVHGGLARLYYESMMPALLGYQDVVLDRSWLDEPIYSDIMSRGPSRIGPVFQRMLERAALRCNAVVINCLPKWETVAATYRKRIHLEYVDTESKLSRIYAKYSNLRGVTLTSLPMISYDYEEFLNDNDRLYYLNSYDNPLMGREHPLKYDSAGWWKARIVMLGEGFADIKDRDSLHQVPFMSWSKEGVSQWFTQQLHDMGVHEHEMQWVNVNDLDLLAYLKEDDRFDDQQQYVIALGDTASKAAREVKVDHIIVPHPMYWKRFRIKEPYAALSKALREARFSS